MSGRQVLVTGGASGFGRGIAARFIEGGDSVTILDINTPLLNETAAELGATAITCDITDRGQVEACIEGMPAIDVLINNAGVTHLPGPLEQVSTGDFDRIIQVNMKAVFTLCQCVVPRMKEKAKGVILNIASTAGVSPRPNLTWYNASKGWLITATKSMAIELAPDNIRVNALNPVAGETPLLASFMGEDTPEMREKFLSTIPLGRFSTPRDIAEAACFLCSDAAGLITGVALEVDGGRTI